MVWLAFFFFVTPIFWLFLLKIAGLSLNKFTIPSFLFYEILVFQYLGYPILYFQADEYRSEFVNDQEILKATFFLSNLAITQLLIGFIFGKKIFGELHWKKKNLNKNQVSIKQTYKIILFGIFCIGVLIIYLQKIGLQNTALNLALENGSVEKIAFLRSEMGNNFPGKYHWYQLFMRSGLLLVVIFFFNQSLIKPKRICNILWFLTFGGFLAFSCLMAAEKAPIAYSILACMVGAVWIRNNGSLSPKILFLSGIMVILVLLACYRFFMGDQSLKSAAASVVSRSFTGQLQATYHYVEIFPKVIPWLNGSSLPNPRGLLPFTPFNLTQELSDEVFPQEAKAGIVGSMPSIFWVELYANFGYWGLLGTPILIGIFLYFVNFIIFQFPFNSLSVAFFSWAIVHYSALSRTFFSDYFFDIKIIILGLFVLCISYKKSKLKI